MNLTSEMFQIVRTNRLDKALYQYGTLLSAEQYSLPHSETLRLLKGRISLDPSPGHAPDQASGDSVLDWGAGNGHFSYFLAHHGIKSTAFTFQEIDSLVSAQRKIKVVMGSPNEPVRLPFANQEFAAVFSIGVLEHVHETGGDQLQSMKEIYRVLKPGGLFCCYHFPNRYAWVEFTVRVLKRFMPINNQPHSRTFTESDIKTLCRESGFRLLEFGRYNFLPRNTVPGVPARISRSKSFHAFFTGLDWVLEKLFNVLCAQIYFIAEKIEDPSSPSR